MAKSSKPSVAILGASANRAKFGNKSVRAHLKQGYEVYPVNPRGGEVEGLKVFSSLAEVPAAHLNRVSVYLSPAVTMLVLEEIAAKGCDELWLNPGSENAEVVRKAESLGLNPIRGCSIIDCGVSPSELDD